MKYFSHNLFLVLGLCLAQSLLVTSVSAEENPLPSWNDGPTRSAIIEFVERVTDKNSPDFVPVDQRVATFDNDGTLWAEQPLYFQGLFALDRVRQLAAEHPEWKETEPFKSVIAGDIKGIMASGKPGIEKILFVTHANLTAEDFAAAVRNWLETARHPETGMLYTQMVYQPMLDLLNYLRENQFKVFIVSGGGVDFMRVFTEHVYGIPPEQVVGTSIEAKFEMRDGIPEIVKVGQLVLLDDKQGKPVGIYQHIGRRPILAAGNSEGDLEMLQYTTIARNEQDQTPRLGLIVHHTDAKREWAYDRQSSIGRLDQALDEAPSRGWQVIDMKKDWKQIFPVLKP